MSSPAFKPPKPPTPGPILCRGNQIEYKAFARHFEIDQNLAGLVLLATCYFNSTGVSIFFERTTAGFQLMEQPPGDPVAPLFTYCTCSWINSFLEEVPSQVAIVDAFGEHDVHVERW